MSIYTQLVQKRVTDVQWIILWDDSVDIKESLEREIQVTGSWEGRKIIEMQKMY